MAEIFHLKLITQRAAGGDPIGREREVPGPEATIGRAATNDVVLPDLAVDPSGRYRPSPVDAGRPRLYGFGA